MVIGSGLKSVENLLVVSCVNKVSFPNSDFTTPLLPSAHQARSQPIAAGGASLPDSTKIIGVICARCQAMCGDKKTWKVYPTKS